MNPDLQNLLYMLGGNTNQDMNYSSGQEYAQSIAGGQNVPGMIAPGVSYSAARPEGYTQADLTPAFYNPGPVPVMPSAPTQGNPSTTDNQMPHAPPGVTTPERYMPFIPITNAESLKNISDLFNANLPNNTQVSFDPFIPGEPMAIDDLMPSVSSSPIDFSFNPFVDSPNVDPVVAPELPVLTPGMTVEGTQPQQSKFAPQVPKQPSIPAAVSDFIPSLQNNPTGPVDMPFIPNEPMPSVSMQDYNDRLIKELLGPTPVSSPIQNFGGYNNVRSFL